MTTPLHIPESAHERDAFAVLCGLALGDALGWPTEFKDLAAIRQEFGPSGILEPPDPAIFTDDTQMTIAAGEAIARYPWSDLDVVMGEMAQRFIAWARSPDNNRAPGMTCMKGVRNLETGTPWRLAGIEESAGCGAAMRVALIGYLYSDQPLRLIEVAEASAVLTHRHPLGVAPAIGAAYMIKLALEDYSPLEMIEPTVEAIPECPPEFSDKLRAIPALVELSDEDLAKDFLGQGWVGHEAVALALYCAARYPTSWIGAVRCGANSPGDSDSIACIAGGIQAARLGIRSIPEDWIARLERRDEILELSRRINGAKTGQ